MVRAKPKLTKTPIISVPKPEDERIRVGKVGVMAAAGLVIGILWPRLAGFHLVPAPPSQSSPAASASASASASVSSMPGPSQAAPGPSSKAPDAPDTNPPGVTPPRVSLAQVVSCQSKDGRQTHCDAPPIESVIESPLRALIACDGADSARGVLSLGFDVDFESNKLDNFVAGKSTTLPSALAKRLVHCAEKELARVSLEGVSHPMSSYRVFYKLNFGADPESVPSTSEADKGGSTPASGEVVAASGRVTVTWDAALVRSKPKDGDVLARVLGGTRVTVTGHQGDWYRVKYDGKGSEGWVYRGAIGL